jgi:hypothetical protein
MTTGKRQQNADTLVSPFTPVFVVEPADASRVPLHAITAVRLSVETMATFRQTVPLLQELNNRFVVVLEDEQPDETTYELLLHAIFQKAYLFTDDAPVILIGSPGYAEKTNAVAAESGDSRRLQVRLAAQGYHRLNAWSLEPAFSVAAGVGPVIVNGGIITNERWVNDNILSGFEALSNFVVFDCDTFEQAVSKEKELAAACLVHLENNPLLANAFREYTRLKKDAAFAKTENARLMQQLSGAEKTIDVIRTKYKDDYENLFKWYHNEYEILPLWYKRFGHILKVIMGKRSFRSLFSDDVKKYKD